MNKQREKSHKILARTLPKARAKEIELEFRSKKQKNELHMLKMSQEWDLRRQKRRLDRQKWVEERRNQKLPIWQRVGNLRVQANEEIFDEDGNEVVNKKQQIENSNKTDQKSISRRDETRENSLKPRPKETENALGVQTTCFPGGTASGTSLGEEQNKETEIKFIKIEQTRTMEQPLLYNMDILKTTKSPIQITERGSITALNYSSKSPGDQPKEVPCESEMSTEKAPEVSRKSDIATISIQNVLRVERRREASVKGEPDRACADRKRKLEAISVDSDFREMPSLLRVDKPTTLESIESENGPVTISSSANDSVIIKPIAGEMEKTASGKGETMPQIKQCYSLLDRREETPNVNLFATKTSLNTTVPASISIASQVTKTTAYSDVKSQGAQLPSVAVDPKCIVYLSKAPPAPVTTPGAPNHSRPGYLVPIYKANAREPAYAFLPAGAQRPHRVGDKSGLEGRSHDYKTDCSIVDRTTAAHNFTHSYPRPRSTTGLKEVHTGCVSSTGKCVPYSQATPALYRDPILQTTRVHSCYEPVHTNAKALNPSQGDSAFNHGDPKCGESRNHGAKIHHEPIQPLKTTAVYSVGPLIRPETISTGSAAPLTEEVEGTQATPENLHYQAFNRTPEAAPNQTALNAQEPIYNPMSLYVRAKLVPREVVVVNHGGEPSPTFVEYIKTDSICDRELTKWNAKNVADFIAATDCADKAELFVEQEIDGKALLSLSPEMLMKGMNLKLGPSVKLFNHIANLRTALLL